MNPLISTNQNSSPTSDISSSKLAKLKFLVENSKGRSFFIENKGIKNTNLLVNSEKSSNFSPNLSKDLSLYLSIIEKPVNLLFSIDQFLFEFSKKTYQQKKTGEFFQQLKERKKLSLFYGHLTRKQISNLFDTVQTNKGYFSKNILSLLERRLDVIIYRSGLVTTIAEARQLIKHKKVLVNHNGINVPSYLLQPGDIVSLMPETGNQLTHQLVNLINNKQTKNHSKSFGEFYSKLKKILNQRIRQKFQSKVVCQLLIQLLCTRMKLRSFFYIKKDKTYLTHHKLTPNGSINGEKTILTLFKWKSLFTDDKNKLKYSVKTSQGMKYLEKKDFFQGTSFFIENKGLESSKTFSQKKNYKTKQHQQENLYANGGSLQKKPMFWGRLLINLKQRKSSWLQKRDNKMRPILKKKNVALYRTCFLLFLKYLENYKKFTRLVSLNMKRSLFKRSVYKPKSAFLKKLNFRVMKPIHLEVSYNLLQIIYLYSPQRLNFPFYIDLDLIKRSLR